MGGSKHIGNASTWVAVCSAPDYCQVGNSVVPFDSFAIINNSTIASPNVIAQGVPVYRVGDMHQSVQADAGVGIPSGTSLGGGCVKFLQGENNVIANGLPVVRHGSACLVNCNGAGIGGALGRVVTEVLVSWAKSEGPSDALRALLEEEWDERAWYERAWDSVKGAAKSIDSAVRFVPSDWEPSGTPLDVLIGAGKGLVNLGSDSYNLANYVSKNISFGHAIQQRQLEKAAITAFQNGDTASANRLANEAAEMTTSGYVEDIFTLENEAQRRGSFLSMLVPVGTIVKGLGTAARVFRGAKVLDASADAVKVASAAEKGIHASGVAAPAAAGVADAAAGTGRAADAARATSAAGQGGVHVAPKGPPRFTQTTASQVFKNGPFVGQKIDDVAAGLRNGTIKPSQLPVDVIVRNGEVLALNTRSSLALLRSGVNPSQWTIVNRTGDAFFERLLTERLARNGLTEAGTDVLRITGAGKNASKIR